MSDPTPKKTFLFESFMNDKEWFDILDQGVHFRSTASKEDFFVSWQQIGSIVDHESDGVTLYDEQEREIFSIKYATQGFAELLLLICQKLALLREKELTGNRFKRKLFYFIFFYIKCGFAGLLFVLMIQQAHPVLFLMLCLLAAFSFFYSLQTKEIIIEDTGLQLVSFLKRKRITFAAVKGISFEVRKRHKGRSYLAVVLEFESGKKKRLYFFKDLLLLAITLLSRMGLSRSVSSYNS